MARCFVALVALLTAGCATLDTSRPIEKVPFLWADTAEQDGHELNEWGTRARLSEFEVSRAAAQRSTTEAYLALGMVPVGLGLYFVGSATEKKGVMWAGAGLEALGLVSLFMARSDYWRAIDLYNTRFQPSPSATRPAVAPYLTADARGATVGMAGHF